MHHLVPHFSIKTPLEFSTLSKQQQQVIAAFEEGKNLFVTGAAGCGKSYLLNYLKRHYEPLGLAITASTGIAAVNISGSTIYSWAGIGLANMPVEQILQDLLTAKFSRVRRRIKQARALAIDEISMISAGVLEILDHVFRQVRNNDRPMGGLQMLFFGDFLQLPPINKMGQDFNFCFNSEAWNDLSPQVFSLSESFRQSDKNFVKLLNNLRVSQLDEHDIKVLKSRVGVVDPRPAIKPTLLTTHNVKVEQINETELKKIPGIDVTHKADYFGLPQKIEFLKKNCMARETLKLKVGAQVMMIKNSRAKDGIVNGSLGVVRSFSTKKNYPVVEFANGKTLTIDAEEWLIEKFDEEKKSMVAEAGMSQVPLVLAWALTIHKSQGLTLDKISCDLADVFTPGQAYVALSRAKSLEGVFIQSINFSRISSDPRAVSFYQQNEIIS